MGAQAEILREAMVATGTSQSALARLSGVRQPSISAFLAGRVAFSDEQLGRLLACLGFQLEVVRRAVEPSWTRSEQRSWLLHRRLSSQLTHEVLEQWRPVIEANLQRLERGVRGEPHGRNLRQWRRLVEEEDLLGLHRVLTGVDRDAVEMREVSPMSGLLGERERREILAGRAS